MKQPLMESTLWSLRSCARAFVSMCELGCVEPVDNIDPFLSSKDAARANRNQCSSPRCLSDIQHVSHRV